MSTAQSLPVQQKPLPAKMLAAVYRGQNDVRLEDVPVPRPGPGELLIRVHTCGICGTDLKKISTGSHSAPRIFGHETAGTVVETGAGVQSFALGDRVMVFHHIPCGGCYYCNKKVFAQCTTYKKVGATAGFEPSGGGFAEYVLVKDWIVGDNPQSRGATSGVVKIPVNVRFEQASFIEPINTCLKGIETLKLVPGETVLVIGAGPIGLMLSLLAKRTGASVITSDLFSQRLTMAQTLGLQDVWDGSKGDIISHIRQRTEGRGADAVILAVGGNSLIQPALDATRQGGRVLLFAQTQHGEAKFDPAAVCVDEKALLGSYSASVDLQAESVRLVFGGELPLEKLITHRFPLRHALEALHLAAHPQPDSMKVVIQPGV